MNERDSEQVLAYLRGELTEQERQEIDARRLSDPVFNELFVAHAKIAAAARLSNLDAKLTMLREHAHKSSASRVVPLRRLISITAACGLLAIAVFFILKYTSKPNAIFTTHFSNAIVPGQGELSGTSQAEIAKAFDAYNRGQFPKAARLFDALRKSSQDPEYILYAGISHLGAGHTDAAEQLLNAASGQLDKLKEQIILLHALVYVRRNDLLQAKEFIEANASVRDSYPELQDLYADILRQVN